MNTEYQSHLLEWTDEKVARFWNFYNNYPAYDEIWFTKIFGEAVLKLVDKKKHIEGKILDYGTGKGFLLQHLLKHYKINELYACDFTPNIVKDINEKFKSNPAFQGCLRIAELPTAYEDNFFDIVFLLETIEHLTDTYLHATLQEINRIVKPGGTIVITTPNEEILEKAHVHCPECGATFHLMQHVRTWNTRKIEALADEFNFKTRWCKALNFEWYSQQDFSSFCFGKLKHLFKRSRRPNLIYIGEKKVVEPNAS